MLGLSLRLHLPASIHLSSTNLVRRYADSSSPGIMLGSEGHTFSTISIITSDLVCTLHSFKVELQMVAVVWLCSKRDRKCLTHC